MRLPFSRLLRLLVLVIAGLSGIGEGAVAAPRASELVRVELFVEPDAIRPGEPFEVAVRLTAKEGWHTYWRNPGDSGLPTEIKWTLPEGFAASAIAWPVPERLPVADLVNYGYEGAATLLVRLTPPAGLPPGRPVPIRADVSYLVCERECIPGEASLSASVDVARPGSPTRPDPLVRHVFSDARAAQPLPAPWPAALRAEGDTLTLRVAAPDLRADTLRSVFFFPFDETAIEHAAPQSFRVRPDGLEIDLKRSPLATGPAPAELPGVLVLAEALDGTVSRQGFAVGTDGATAGTVEEARPAADTSFAAGLAAAGLAFLGGLILNLMPCVFPVLSIKVLSLVRQSGQSAGAVRLAGLAYAAGILCCFGALAGFLLALRAAGAEVGWGFQLQSPAFVAALAFLLFAMALSLSGAVSFGASLGGVGARFADRSGPAGSFATGIVAAVVATPCTAPFMGAATGYALTAPAPVALAVFGALGLGMAAPFLLLTLRPAWLSGLPRPGAWMETLKQLLAFPLYATVAWLVFVLSQQVGPGSFFALLLGFVLLAFGFWCLRWADGRGRALGRVAAATAVVGVAAIAWTAGHPDARPVAAAAVSAADGGASAPQPFTQARLDALRREGRPVFVNMTAAWCITCLVNERSTLAGEAVRRAFAERDVAYLKGDWTNRDPEITRLLARHGRSGVPLYVLYPPGREGVVLPQILTEAAVLEPLARTVSAGTKRAALPAGTGK